MLQLTTQQLAHCSAVVTALRAHSADIHPVIAEPYYGTAPLWFDLTEHNADIASLDMTSPAELERYINKQLQSAHAKFGIGRYNEDRIVYRQSQLFREGETEPRSVHLAFDIWLPIGTPLYAPLPGTIHSFQDNANFLDYGPTIILQHSLDSLTFYSLYGHLARRSLRDKAVGQTITGGETFAWIGVPDENGQWAPHVHAQIICDLLGRSGDFPGVARPSECDYYTTLCPDPSLLFNY